MKPKSLMRCLPALAVLAALLWLPGPGQAQEGGLSESFDDPALPGWERSPTVVVADGVLRVPPDSFAFRGGRWEDFTLSLRARRGGGGFLAIHYRATDEGAYVFSFGDTQVALQREGRGGGSSWARHPPPRRQRSGSKSPSPSLAARIPSP